MFGKKKDPKILESVKVTFSRAGVPCFTKVISVPPGARFKVGFAERPRLIDEDGNLLGSWEWEGGYEMEYEFMYAT